MRFGKSCFNATLYKKNLTRFWPVWALYLVIWMFALPFDLVLSGHSNPVLNFSQRQVLRSVQNVGLALAVAFGLLVAVAVWSYLYNNRSAGFMHTLPVRREGLFLTNFLSGLTFFVGSNLIIFLMTLVGEILCDCVAMKPLLIWLAAVTLMDLFFFCFATFCAMFTGHILGLPAYYGVLSVLSVALVSLLDAAFSRFVFGYDGIEGVYTVARWLSPVANLIEIVRVRRVQEVAVGLADAPGHYEFEGLGLILIYAVAGLLLAALALVVYRRRHMERSGDAITVSWVRPVFQYGVAFCCALAFGVVFFEMFSGVLPETAWVMLLLMLVSGAVGYFLARMVLEKSFRVFGCWKGCLPFLAVLVVLVCGMELDVTGFERRVPDFAQVESVSVDGIYTMPDDTGSYFSVWENSNPEIIGTVLDLHRAVADSKNEIEGAQSSNRSVTEETGYRVDTMRKSGFRVTYHLKNGAVMSRDYVSDIPVYAECLKDEQTVSGKLNKLVNLQYIVEENYRLTERRADELIDVVLANQYGVQTEIRIDKDAYAQVLEAVLADFAEGNLGRRYLMNDKDRMNCCFVNDLEFTFYHEGENGADILVETVAVPIDRTEMAEKYHTTRIRVTLQTTARHTLAALDRAGVLPEPVYLLTHAQMEAAGTAADKAGILWESIDFARYAEEIIGG